MCAERERDGLEFVIQVVLEKKDKLPPVGIQFNGAWPRFDGQPDDRMLFPVANMTHHTPDHVGLNFRYPLASIREGWNEIVVMSGVAKAWGTDQASEAVTVVSLEAAVRETRRSLFGFQIPKLPFFSGDDSADAVPDQIESTVKAVEEIGRGRYRIVIADHDAVWETIDSPMRLNAPRKGDKIIIKRGLIGAYFLRIDGQVGVKGRRVG
jgi:hypothetical protein